MAKVRGEEAEGEVDVGKGRPVSDRAREERGVRGGGLRRQEREEKRAREEEMTVRGNWAGSTGMGARLSSGSGSGGSREERRRERAQRGKWKIRPAETRRREKDYYSI